MRKKVRFLLAGLLVADVLLIGYLMYDYGFILLIIFKIKFLILF